MSIDDSSGTLRDLRNDINSFNFSTPRAVQDVTGIDKSAMERLLLLADLSFSWSGTFNDESNKSHDVFKTVPSTSVAREILLNVSGQILGTTPQVTVLLTDYALTRAADGSLVWQVPGVLANGEIPTWTT
jgi:hypothetical protein